MAPPNAAIAFLLALACTLADAAPASAARYIEARIQHDGSVILRSGFGVDDYAAIPATWKTLANAHFEVVGDWKPKAGGDTVTLTGNIKLELAWNNKTQAAAQLDRLTLMRVPGTTNKWDLSPDEVTRTAAAAGLTLPPEPTTWLGVPVEFLWLAVSALVVLGIGFWWVRRSATHSEA